MSSSLYLSLVHLYFQLYFYLQLNLQLNFQLYFQLPYPYERRGGAKLPTH